MQVLAQARKNFHPSEDWSFTRYSLGGSAIQVSWGPPEKCLSINQVLTLCYKHWCFLLLEFLFLGQFFLVLCIMLSDEVIYKKSKIRELQNSWTVRGLFKAQVCPSCRWYCFGIPSNREDGFTGDLHVTLSSSSSSFRVCRFLLTYATFLAYSVLYVICLMWHAQSTIFLKFAICTNCHP